MKANKIIKLLTIGSMAGISLSGLSELSAPHTNNMIISIASAASTNPANKIIGVYKASSGIIYTLIQKTGNIFIFRKPDGSVSTKTFSSKQAVINYLKTNSPAKKTVASTDISKKVIINSSNNTNILNQVVTQNQVIPNAMTKAS